MKTPLSLVKERFGEKTKLVEAVEKLATDDLWIDRINDVKGLAKVSNAKLLRLHDVLSSTKQEFGTRAKLVDAILDLENRSKDAGYKVRLERYPLPRLLDVHRSAARRRQAAERKASAGSQAVAKPKKPARSKKAQAKAAGAK